MPGSLKKRGKIWYGRVRYQGKERTRSLETESKTVARDRLSKWIEELRAENWGETKRRTFNECADRLVTDHFPYLKHSSAVRYAVSLNHLIDHFSGMHLDAIASAKMSSFEKKRRKQGVSKSTIRRDFYCLSIIFSCAMQWEWIKYNPVPPYLRDRKKKGLAESEPRTRYLSQEEERAILDHAGNMAPLIAFAIDTGLRREEMFSLTWADINLRDREITIGSLVSKSKKRRTIPIAERSVSILEDIPRNLRHPHVFVNSNGRRYAKASPYIWEGLQKAVKRAGIPHTQWHDLRRTCGCRLLQDKGFSMEEVRDWMGHSSVTVTERIYAFLAKDQLQKRLRESEAEIVEFPARGSK